MQSEPMITKVVSLNPVHEVVYLIQHYVIKFVSDLRQVCGFLCVLRFPPTIKPPQYNLNIVESGVKHHIPSHHYIYSCIYSLNRKKGLVSVSTFISYCYWCTFLNTFQEIWNILSHLKILNLLHIIFCFAIF